MDRTQEKDAGEAGSVVNDVRLVGRLTGVPVTVELPSGDTLVTFRVSVPRTSLTGIGSGGRGVAGAATRSVAAGQAAVRRVDSVPCTAWSPRLRRGIGTWRVGDLVEVSGAVRCRFFQAGGATRSRVEVEAVAARIIRRSSAS